MHTENLTIIGAGGHSKVVISAVRQKGADAERISVTDDDVLRNGQMFCGLTICAPVETTLLSGSMFHVAVGSNDSRQRLYDFGVSCGGSPVTIAHPGSFVAAEAEVGEGSFLAAGSVVGPYAKIAKGVIVNHGSVVDHDCKVGAFAHIAPNATLGGRVVVGARVMVGAGANILPGVEIGDDAVVAAGAVVIDDVLPGTTVIGVPALVR